MPGRSPAGPAYHELVMLAEDLDILMGDLESERVERTVSRDATDKFCEAICAFANDLPGSGNPGYLFVGVKDRGEVDGKGVDDALLIRLAGYRDNGQIIPIPSLSVFRHRTDAGDVAVVRVEPSDMPPVRYKQRVWIRVGPTKRLATPQEERTLAERRVDRAATWDLRACREAGLEDLALDLFTLNYLPRAVSAEVLEENQKPITARLDALRFWHRRFECPTNAGILTFGKDPERFMPGAYVQHVVYDGTGSSDPVVEERRLSGDLLSVLRSLHELARTHAHTRPTRDSTLREADVHAYPPPRAAGTLHQCRHSSELRGLDHARDDRHLFG